MASPSGGSDDVDDEHLFEGVRFVLVGFDEAAESQYRSDMVQRGGVDAGRLGNGCTHVIVWGLLYDDPECVLAREQGKKVVNELWVDDSLDYGVLADADRALYWPMRHVNGIPGAESLVICLTGFQKKYRDDIMKMVSLMGAQFSKPLVGNLVTHLICYKFEGEKYELAKKVHMKLVNHRWLEDCLKEWKILPADGYIKKSTWELELMETQVKDSEDESEDTGQRSLKSRSRIMCTPSMTKYAETSVNSDVKTPMQSPVPIIPNGNKEVVVGRQLNTPGHIREIEDADTEVHNSTIQGGPHSAKVGVSAPIETPSVLSVKRKNTAVRKMSSPNPVKEPEEKHIGARALDNTIDAIGTLNWSANKLDSSKINEGQHQEKDSPSGTPLAAVVQSSEKSYPNSGGDSMSNDINKQSNSSKKSQKSLAPKRLSNHHSVSHQKTEESMLRAGSHNSTLEMEQLKVAEHADIQGMKSNETNRNVDAPYAQQGKNLNSPVSSKMAKEDLVSETSPLHCPSTNRLSGASEAAKVSYTGTNPAEDTAVDLEKQQSSLYTSIQSRLRQTSLKHAGLVNEGKHAEHSSCDQNVKSLSKSRSPLKAMKKDKWTTSSSATVRDGKISPDFSFDNMDGKVAEASVNAVNQDCLHLMREIAHSKNQAHDISEHSSGNSQVVSCLGIANNMITAVNGDCNEVAAAWSDSNAKEGTKGFQYTTSNVQVESHLKRAAVPTERTVVAKRRQSACMEIDGSVVNTGKKLVPESQPTKVIPQKHTASAAELKAVSPKKVPISREGTRNALTKIDDVEVALNLEDIFQENTELSPAKFSDANVVEHKSKPPKKLRNTRVGNTAAKKSQKSVTNLGIEASIDKIEAMAANTENPAKVFDIANVGKDKSNPSKKLCDTRVGDTAVNKSLKSVTNLSNEGSLDKTETIAENSELNPAKVSDKPKGSNPHKKMRTRAVNTTAKKSQKSATDLSNEASVGKTETIAESPELNPGKVSDIANVGEDKSNPPKKLHDRVGNAAADKSQKSITNLSSEGSVDKTVTMAAGSLFHDLFPEDNVEDGQKMLSSSASATDCGALALKNLSASKVRSAVAKRKMEDSEHKIDSKCSKVGSAIASIAKAVSAKRIKKMSCNLSKVIGEHNFEKYSKDGTRDVSGLSCQDSATVDKPGVHNSNWRSSKCNKVLTTDHEKENIQSHSDLNSKPNACTGSLGLISDAKSMMRGTDVFGKNQSIKGNESRKSIVIEPALFILSGHRQQRKDYRSILRRLKGRVCKDSHHWSYQATHFIGPEPLKRTEKFFAAAAAGRWILKSDYLTSCSEAGKFLDEELFEWFGTGLSDGENISLEAPRKWRILKQQTHHGAFYGMRIIVYGQLKLPTLDTVKRAVQAGDGTILATSPPYTRFLDSDVDFAVVASSIPSEDAWVQEFIRHGIPCISADYLVEYVCKPGHPLDNHVLFETHDLANRSLEKLMKKQQEVARDDEAEQSGDDDNDGDLSCSVCGWKDSEDVMLICGDEGGTAGCGIGMHIDCCDPPLDAVPEDDWLCPKCRVQEKSKAEEASRTRSTARKLRPSKEM